MTKSGLELDREARRLASIQTRSVLTAAAGKGLGLALAAGSIFILCDALLGLSSPARAAGAAAVIALAAVPFAAGLVRRLPAILHPLEAARATEREAGELRERLVPALQILVHRDDARTGYSSALVDAFVDDVLSRVRSVSAAALPSRANARRGLVLAGAGAAAALVLTASLGTDRTLASARRFASALSEVGPKPPAAFRVTPGNVALARGSEVTLEATVLRGDAPVDAARAESGVLEMRSDPEAPWVELALAAAQPLQHRIARVETSFEYRFASGRDRSETFTVDALDAPTVRIEEIRYEYPAYTGLAARSVTDGNGDLTAVKGTRATVIAHASNQPRRASLVREKGDAIELAAEGDGLLRGEIPILEEGSYRVEVEDRIGARNVDPIVHRIQPLVDEAPFIRLLEPGEDRDLDESLRVTLRWSAIDDYGLGPVRLVHESSRAPGASRSVAIYTPQRRTPEASSTHEWNLEELDLLPGDSVTYFLETQDNNAVDGPSKSRTRAYVLRFPTLAEIYAEIDEGQESSIDEMKNVAEEIRKVEEKVEKVGREMLKQGEASWENRQEMQRAVETQEKLAEELRKIQDQVDESMTSLLESEFMSFEALEKMERLQQLLDEVMNEDMKNALEKLREAMEQENVPREDEKLADFKKAQEELMKNLDRVIENLEQFRFEEKVKATVRELEELAARQERVNEDLGRMPEEKRADEAKPSEDSRDEADSEKADESEDAAKAEKSEEAESSEEDDASKSSKEASERENEKNESEKSEEAEKAASPEDERERLAQEEKALSEETKRVEQELENLAQMTKKLRDSQDQKSMEKVAEDMKSKDIPQTMDEMSEEMSQGESQSPQEKGEKALTELRETMMALSQQQSSMAQRQVAISQAAINRAVRDLLALSEEEEALAGNLEEIPRNTVTATRAFADEQRRLLQGAERVDAMLEEVAKGTPLMESVVGQTLDHGMDSMREAAYGLESGAVQLANQEGEAAVDDLNAVVIHLLRTMQSMSSCPSGNPMSNAMQQLESLSQDQGKLNEMMRELREQMKSGKSQRLQGQMQSLADEQRRIQGELDKLLSEIGEGGGLLGKLDDVSKKLDEVAERMQDGELGDQILKDQEWALTRLLDSQRSIRERDFGKERRSESGEELADRPSPSDLPPGLEELDRDLREDLLKALDRRYPPKYEELVKRYFRSLSREERAPDLP
jgi:hypothetical protein